MSMFVLGRHRRASPLSFLAPADQLTLLESTWRDFRCELYAIGNWHIEFVHSKRPCRSLYETFAVLLRSSPIYSTRMGHGQAE